MQYIHTCGYAMYIISFGLRTHFNSIAPKMQCQVVNDDETMRGNGSRCSVYRNVVAIVVWFGDRINERHFMHIKKETINPWFRFNKMFFSLFEFGLDLHFVLCCLLLVSIVFNVRDN